MDWEQRHAAMLAGLANECGFNDEPDHAALLVRLFEASNNRHSEDRQDPVLGPILDRAAKRYGELRGRDFAFASRVAMTEAARAVLALPIQPQSGEK